MIRELRDDDIATVAALLRTIRDDHLYTEAGERHAIASTPARAEAARWVAEEDGAVVGFAVAGRRWWRTGQSASVWVGVLPVARRRGLGSALWDRIERHAAIVGVGALHADSIEGGGDQFLTARGFTPDRLDRVSALDVTLVDPSDLPEREARAAADGYRVASLAEADDLHSIYELDIATADDMPGSAEPHAITFDEWRAVLVGNVNLDAEATTVIFHDARPVAISWLAVDPKTGRARNEGTGTAREHRGRGLATLAKLVTIRWARANDVTEIITENAEENAAMLAVNRRLGYRPYLTRQRWIMTRAAGTTSAQAPAAPAP